MKLRDDRITVLATADAFAEVNNDGLCVVKSYKGFGRVAIYFKGRRLAHWGWKV